jgi:hypothetical protein
MLTISTCFNLENAEARFLTNLEGSRWLPPRRFSESQRWYVEDRAGSQTQWDEDDFGLFFWENSPATILMERHRKMHEETWECGERTCLQFSVSYLSQ